MLTVIVGIVIATVAQLLKTYVPLVAQYPKVVVVLACTVFVAIVTRFVGTSWVLTLIFAVSVATAFYEYVIKPIAAGRRA